MKIIGISAKMRCGKSTFAKLLLKKLHTKKCIKLSFGSILKEMCSKKFNFPLEWCYTEEGKNNLITLPDDNIITVRRLLQWWGTDVCRASDPDFWVKRTKEKIDNFPSNTDYVIIDDVRFPNECTICDITLRLEPYTGYVYDETSIHESETALDYYKGWSHIMKPEFGYLDHAVTALIYLENLNVIDKGV